jgi:hypothetical protein
MERRLLRPLRPLPPRRLLRLRDPSGDWDHLRRRIRRVHDRLRPRARADAGRAIPRRGRPPHVRRAHRVQRPQEQRRHAGRRRRRAGPGRARPPRYPVRREDGLPHGRDRTRGRTRKPSHGNSGRRPTSTARPRTPPRSSSGSAAPGSSWRRRSPARR